MPRTEDNPFDAVRDQLVSAMEEVGQDIRERAGRTKPYDSVKLTPDEESLVWENPAAKYPNDIDQLTGLPLTNAQAAHKWYMEVTRDNRYPSRWIELVEDMNRRKTRRDKDHMMP